MLTNSGIATIYIGLSILLFKLKANSRVGWPNNF